MWCRVSKPDTISNLSFLQILSLFQLSANCCCNNKLQTSLCIWHSAYGVSASLSSDLWTSEAGVRPYSSSSNWQWTALGKELYKYSPLWFSPWKCDNVLVEVLEVAYGTWYCAGRTGEALLDALSWALPFCFIMGLQTVSAYKLLSICIKSTKKCCFVQHSTASCVPFVTQEEPSFSIS